MIELVKLENVDTMNWRCALRGMRNPLESWDKSDTTFMYLAEFNNEYPTIGENDLNLCMRLIKAGSDHRKFLRQIFISFDLTAPESFWREYATYKVGTVENSTSQMHKLGSRELTNDDFSIDTWDYGTDAMLDTINDRMTYWQKLKNNPDLYHKEAIKQAWRDMIQVIPSSFKYRRTCTMNYEVLKGMYNARKSHKLAEWRQFLDELLGAIPYPEFITTNRGD